MPTWKQALREGVVSGSVGSVLSTAALLLAGRRDTGHPAAPVNAISHWLWEPQALRQDAPSARHTLTGYAIHHAASIFWGTIHAKAWGGREEHKRPVPALAGGAVASAVACFVDYRLTPDRLTPGLEHRLSRRSMAMVYACFGLGIALGNIAMRHRPVRRQPASARVRPPR